jgi:SOS-response transcriptional repressor LexA
LAQTTVSALERGEFEIGKMSALKTAALLEALEWTPLEFEECTGISAAAVEAYYRGGMAVTDEGPRVVYLGEVSAGNGNSSADMKMVSVPTWIAERYDLRDVFAMTVSGTSMVCEQVENTIPEGSLVYFHARLKPHPGEVVCCYLQHQDMQVVKIYKPERKYTILESYNVEMRDKPITIDEGEPGVLKGVYLSHEVRGPRYNR